MKKYFFLSVFILAVTSFAVFAQQDDPLTDITYPVAELGDCQNQEECEAYCALPENMEPCINFAEAHNLLPEEEIAIAKKMLAAGEIEGPGGCQGQAECSEYCDDIGHIRECVAFAEEHDLMPEEELEEARMVADAIDRGVQPPPCNSKTECDDVCRLPENMMACLTFAKEAGLMPPEDLEEAEKVLAAIERGVMPPPCGGKEECDEYCAEPEHLDECITFAEAAGFISPEEAEMVKRTGGKGPGGCRGKDECEAYCDDFTHMTECVDFAEKAGFMSPEDAERARRMAEKGINMMQGGPGGCESQEECETFCNDPANMETCLDFAVQIGDISPEEAEQARQGMQMMAQMDECLAMPCPEALSCFENLSSGQPPMEQEGEMPEEGGEQDAVQAKIESCMREMMPQEGMMPPEGFEGEMPEGMPPEGFEEEFEGQYREQIEQQMREFVPPEPPPEPTSFFESVKNFLASLI